MRKIYRLKKNIPVFILAIVLLICSYGYGFITSQYKVFPYEKVWELKNKLSSNDQEAEYPVKYLHKKSFYEVNGKQADIVMIGDSITNGAEWHELFSKVSIVNRGIGGDTTLGILNRIDSIISVKPEKAFIMVGVNDIGKGYTPEEVFNSYKQIINTLKNNHITPYIQSTIYTGEKFSYYNKDIKILNDLLREYALQESIVFIDLNSKLSVNEILSSRYSLDDIHLNGLGYSIWKELLDKYI